MSTRFERDIHRWEIRKLTGGDIEFNPVVAGSGSVVLSSCDVTLYQPNGTSVATPTATITSLTTGSQVSFTVPSGLDYDEGYQAVVDCTVSGSGYQFAKQIPFDVVYVPWGPDPLVDYNDIVNRKESLRSILRHMASERSIEQHEVGSQFCYWAHTELDNWIRSRANEQGQIRARAILDVEKLVDIELKLAIHLIYRSISSGDEEDGNENLARIFLADARGSFNALGNFRYDADDDGDEDLIVSTYGRNIPVSRSGRTPRNRGFGFPDDG